jgi:hypothetical protein
MRRRYVRNLPFGSWLGLANLQRGQMMVLTAFAIVAMLAMCGLVYDIGHTWAIQQEMQAAADAAAKAGADEIANQVTANVTSAATYDATQNGFTAGNSSNGVKVNSVTINNPPKSGPNQTQNTYVEAIINSSVSTPFLSVLGVSTIPVTTRAVAKPNPAPICIQTLDGSAHHSLVIGDNSSSDIITVNALTCDVYSDSSNNDPIGTHGGRCLHSLQIFTDQGSADDSDCMTPWPVQTDSPPVSDLLAGTAEPTVGGCTFSTVQKITTSTTLSQGVYCGGIETCNGATCPANPANAITITFNPGLYVINGGGINIGPAFSAGSGSSSTPPPPPGGGSTSNACGDWSPSGMSEPVPNTGTTANVTLTGSGVTFYNTGTSATFAPISIFATANSSLSAPTSNSGGGIEGMLFFQDRAQGSCAINLIYGGTYTGTFYFEPSIIGFGGTAGAYNYWIADKIQFTQNMSIGTDYSSLADGGVVKLGAALAE